MDANELSKKIKNTQPKTVEMLEEVTKWCSDNVNSLNIGDEDQYYLYMLASKYLIQIKIGRWNDNDVTVVINTLAKISASEMNIDQEVNVKILSDEEYQSWIKNSNSKAVCIDNGDDTYTVVYSPKVVEKIKSNNPDDFINGLQSVFHEVVHAQQGSVIHKAEINGQTIEWSGNTYRAALETIVRQINPDFYDNNYDSLFKENQAHFIGLEKALAYIKILNPKLYELYDAKEMEDRLQRYLNKTKDNRDMTYGNITARGDALIDRICSLYIKEHPEEIKRYPVLQRAYNEDGSKKDIIQLLQDRQVLINSGKANAKTDDLYETIANYKDYGKGELLADIDALEDYVVSEGIDDEFVFQLIEQKYKRGNIDEQLIAKCISDIRRKVKLARKDTKGTIETEE